jgi:FkbH-like protein
MDGTALMTLPWLLTAPSDFSSQVKAAASNEALLRLCQYSLNVNQCEKLSKALLNRGVLESLPTTFNLGILSNCTTGLLPAVLTVSAARLGVALNVELTDFDQVMQVSLGSGSAFQKKNLDAILIALDEHFFPLSDFESAAEVLEKHKTKCKKMAQGLERKFQVPLIFQTVPDRGEPLFGSIDIQQAGTRRNMLHLLNTYIFETLGQGPNLVFDVQSLAETVGLSNWYDPKQYFMAKLNCSQAALPLYGSRFASLIAAMKGMSRKCLVFDLDNTIWGGIIGDDGLDGITLGHGSAGGEAFVAVQRCILDYHRRGIVLAVSSKNTHEIAMQAFEQHDDMLLRKEHITVFQANWKDKASNINAIAGNLNLGLDSLVFLDDNPVERQLVRDALPQVSVPELPDDPAYFARVLSAASYFESVAFLDEDKTRNDSYKQNALRIEAFESVGSLSEYLKSLEMVLHIKPFDAQGLPRIVQLVNKTNQFNLTTRRYDEKSVTAMMVDGAYITLQARLTDHYGDSGMIAVVIATADNDELVIDSFLMSCRVLERQVEFCLMNQLIAIAKQRGMRSIRAVYIPTDRNVIVENLYQNMGFSLVETAKDTEGTEGTEATVWSILVTDYNPCEVFIAVDLQTG